MRYKPYTQYLVCDRHEQVNPILDLAAGEVDPGLDEERSGRNKAIKRRVTRKDELSKDVQHSLAAGFTRDGTIQ